MGFLDSLAANPRGSGVYGAVAPDSGLDVNSMIGIVNRLRDRSMADYKEKANFDNDMSQRQGNLRQTFGNPAANANPNAPGMDVVFKDNAPPPISPFQNAGLAIDKAKLGIEGQKLAQNSKFGEERLGIAKDKQELDETKNKQIYETKTADLQRKHDEAASRLKLAEDALSQKGNTAEATAKYHQAQIDALNARHDLDLHGRDAALEEQKRLHDAQIASMQNKSELAGKPDVTTTEVNAAGDKKTVTKGKGGRVSVMGPNGKSGTIDAAEAETLPKGWSVVK